MNKNQINYLIDNHFIPNALDEVKGSMRKIATQLIMEGTCIVAGDGRLWNGGIGNFITGKEAYGAVGCTELTFDSESFMESNYFMDHLNQVIKHEHAEITQAQIHAYDLVKLRDRI